TLFRSYCGGSLLQQNSDDALARSDHRINLDRCALLIAPHLAAPYTEHMVKSGTRWQWGACSKHGELILKMNQDGCSLTKIGKTVGTSRRHIRAFLRGHGETRH